MALVDFGIAPNFVERCAPQVLVAVRLEVATEDPAAPNARMK